MSDRQRLDWRVPAAEWDRFTEFVDDEIGAYDGQIARETEDAMLEWIDDDGLADAEALVDRLVEAAGRRPADLAGRKNKNRIEPGGETTRVIVHVRPTVKEEFAAHVDAHSDDSYGVVLARALREYREGGRAARLEDKLDRVVDDAEGVLAEVADETDMDDDSQQLGQREQKTIAIAERLPEESRDEQLVEEIHDVAGRGRRASEPTVATYRDLVTDHLGVEPHPHNDAIWVPREEAVRIVGEDVPDETRQPVGHLDREDRVRRLQLELGREAAHHSSGKARMEVPTARQQVFDGAVARETVVALQQEAAFDAGFETEETDQNSLRVDLETVGAHEPDLFEAIIDYRDAEADDGLVNDPTETRLTDHGPSASADWDTLGRAEPATDGGRGDARDRDGGGCDE